MVSPPKARSFACLLSVGAVCGVTAIGVTRGVEHFVSNEGRTWWPQMRTAMGAESRHEESTLSSATLASIGPGLGFVQRWGSAASDLAEGDRPLAKNGLCPPDMASVDDAYCIDKYEASLIEIMPDGREQPWSAFEAIEGHTVRAVSQHGVYPQGYVSAHQASDACRRSGKRLCKPREWKKACMGPDKTTYGYGNDNVPRRCNDHGKSPVVRIFGLGSDEAHRAQWSWDKMNASALNQLPGTLAVTGDHAECTNGYGVYDMVGNLHEWVDDPAGTFQGGYYQDIHLNGDGCSYRTMAHEAWYHDYSTGFRCCSDVAP